MSNQLPLLQRELFDEIVKHKLSPNQYYILCCIRDGFDARRVNAPLNTRHLIQDGWLTKEYALTPQSHTLINQLDKMYALANKLSPTRLMGADYKEKIDKYRELFPNIKFPSGKPARSASKNLETAFTWFFKKYRYDWDTVFRATVKYLDKHERENWKYCRTSQYFIRKDDLSTLADTCDAILSNVQEQRSIAPKVNVV